jgi:hypothetical protein
VLYFIGTGSPTTGTFAFAFYLVAALAFYQGKIFNSKVIYGH